MKLEAEMSTRDATLTLCSNCSQPIFIPRTNMNFPDLYAKLRSRYGCATETEILLSCDRDLENAENEVMRLQSEIIYIREQQKRLRDYRAKVHSLSSPTRKIPNEVLTSIFDYACEQNLLQEFGWSFKEEDGDLEDGVDIDVFHDEEYPLPTQLTSPTISYAPALSISATCFRWRSVALSYPDLWSKLKLELTTSKYATPGPFLTRLKLFLSRSGQKPLNIELNVHGPYRTDNSLSELVTSLLAEHSERWKAFKSMCACLELPDTTEFDFSILESLDLRGVGTAQDDVCLTFLNTPKLRELVLLNPRELVSSEVQLSSSLLTSVEVDATGNLSKIIDKCPSLTSLKLLEVGDPFSCSPRTSKSIENLTIAFKGTDRGIGDRPSLLEAIFSSFTFPALTNLHILCSECGFDNRKWPKQDFTTFLLRSSCKITTLVLSAVALSDADLISVIQHLSFLVTLDIGDCTWASPATPITSIFISSLCASSQSPTGASTSPLVPRLRYLSLEFSGTDFDDSAFVNMVISRWLPDPAYAKMVGVDCLRSVVMKFREREVVETVYRPLQYLGRNRKMALRVVVKGKSDSVSRI